MALSETTRSTPPALPGWHDKVTAAHLARAAYLYVRQSTLRQVLENTESRERQYALRERALALGWSSEDIVVIDCDLGQSGAQASDRAGFQRLVGDVGVGKAGIVMGLEVSRLARNSADWHRLLEICALTDTLILDEDGLYDPAHFNDRLLLGLKGTMSEAELHVLKARLRGGVLNKAQRGELWIPPPVGLIYDGHGKVVLDADQQVQAALRLVFDTFRRTGSATATVRVFHREGVLFPRQVRGGPDRGSLLWAPLAHSRVLQVLHNPRYAGAFVFGRTRTRRQVSGGSVQIKVPLEQWQVLIPEVYTGYIPWSEYLANQQRLRDNAVAFGMDRHHGPPREGPALLQGLVVCGRCGGQMTVRYHHYRCGLVPDYVCQREGIEHGQGPCQRVIGRGVDQAVAALLVEMISPLVLQTALAVQEELRHRHEEADRLLQQQVQRARYEADLARRRYMQVDPDNRLVADTLEAEWNGALRRLDAAQREYEQQRQAHQAGLTAEQQAAITALAQDFPRLWASPQTPQPERKRMVRLLVEDVTLRQERDHIVAQLRFPGGAATTLRVPRRKYTPYRHTPPEVITRIDALLEEHTYREIATQLNAEGLQSGEAKRFDAELVQRLQNAYRLCSRYQRLRAQGLLTSAEIGERLGITVGTVIAWRKCGLLQGCRVNDRNSYLYRAPGPSPPRKCAGSPLSTRLSLATTSRSGKGAV
jgi:DNA invertase Pin-like site-specific DNA recombinase